MIKSGIIENNGLAVGLVMTECAQIKMRVVWKEEGGFWDFGA
jgi:hypothetical protein